MSIRAVRLWHVRKEAIAWFRALLEAVPGRTGCYLRARFYGFTAEPGSQVLGHVTVYHPSGLKLGRNASIGVYGILNAAGGIRIDENVLIGPGVKVWSQNHRFESTLPIINQDYDRAPVVIERNSWLAAGVIVLPGVVIGEGTVVAAGAVVTKSTERFSIVAGVPARKIGVRVESV